MPDPLDGYIARSWSTYPITMEEGTDLPTEGTGNDFLQCPADSPLLPGLAAQASYDVAKMFFPDVEQMAAGHNVHGTASVMRLTDELHGHPRGSLAFVSYEGLADEPPTYLLYIEDTSTP